MPCLTVPNLVYRYDSSPISVFAFLLILDDLEEEDDDNNDDNNDTKTPDPVRAQIPSHPGIKYPVRGIPPSDILYIYIYYISATVPPGTPGRVRVGSAGDLMSDVGLGLSVSKGPTACYPRDPHSLF